MKNLYLFGNVSLLENDEKGNAILPARIGELGFALLFPYRDFFVAVAMQEVTIHEQIKLMNDLDENSLRFLEVVHGEMDSSGSGLHQQRENIHGEDTGGDE